MKAIQVYCENGADEGFQKLTEKLREEEIPESRIISARQLAEGLYFRAIIREEE